MSTRRFFLNNNKNRLVEGRTVRYQRGPYTASINDDTYEMFDGEYLPMEFTIENNGKVIDTVLGQKKAEEYIDSLPVWDEDSIREKLRHDMESEDGLDSFADYTLSAVTGSSNVPDFLKFYNIATSKVEVEAYNKKYGIGSGSYSDYEYVGMAGMCFLQPEFGIAKTMDHDSRRHFDIINCMYSPYDCYKSDIDYYVRTLYKSGSITNEAKFFKCKEFPLSVGCFSYYFIVVRNKKYNMLDLIYKNSKLRTIVTYDSVP